MSDDPDADWPASLPIAHWGSADAPLPEVTEDTEVDPDDDLLDETPADVIAILGFDPREFLDAEDDDTPPTDDAAAE